MPLLGRAERNPYFPGSTEEYSQPLYFDVLGSGVQIEPLLLSYEISDDVLTMGSLRMQTDDFYVNLVTLRKGNQVAAEDVFVIQWPEFMMRTGVLEFISRSGKVLWSLDIDENMLENWSANLGEWKTKSQFGVRKATAENSPLWGIKEPFRVCLSNEVKDGHTRLCSAQFRVEMVDRKPRVFKVPYSKQPARVIVNNQQAPLKQEVVVKDGVPVQFYAEISDGSSYEFYAIPKKINLMDMTGNKNKTEAVAITEGERPLQRTQLINKEKSSRFLEFIGWQQTIGDFRQYWRTKIPYGETQIMISGEGGGAFLQKIKVEDVPQEYMRPFLSPNAIEGTYTDGASLYFKKGAATEVTSKQNLVEVDNPETDEFVWEFGAKKRGKMNRSYLLINDGKQTYKAYHELFKGFPRELSLRSTMAGSLSNQILIGEVAFVYWFEDVLGWRNNLFSKQRWGLNARYFRSVNELKLGSISGPFEVTTAEIKYRLTPGMWARKETWGLIGSYQKVGYKGQRTTTSSGSTVYLDADLSGELMGLGFFWARSMPRIFDNILNALPLMNYPKWVDAEFIYYPMTMTPNVEVGQGAIGAGNYALNFHGQIMWSERFFGEAGFGLKQYDYVKPVPGVTGTVRTKFALASLYGTVGLGYRF